MENRASSDEYHESARARARRAIFISQRGARSTFARRFRAHRARATTNRCSSDVCVLAVFRDARASWIPERERERGAATGGFSARTSRGATASLMRVSMCVCTRDFYSAATFS